MRRAARKDANQDEIVEVLRDIGASVAITHQLGNGFPDLVVGFRGENFMLEIKDGRKAPSAQRLTKDEEIFHRTWNGKVDIVKSVDEALKAIGAV